MLPTPLPPYLLVLWNPAGAVEALKLAKEQLGPVPLYGACLHDSLDTFVAHGAQLVALTRQTFPTVRAVWWESEGDAGPPDAAVILAKRRAWAAAAIAAGVGGIVHDIETRAENTNPDPGWRAEDIAAAVAAIANDSLAKPLAQLAYVYGEPTLHENYPYRAFRGVDAWSAEHYAPDLYARSEAVAASWEKARADGMVTGAPRFAEIPAGGGVQSVEQGWMAEGADVVALWVAGCKVADDSMTLDAQGLQTLRVLNALYAKGFSGRACVSRFQRSAGLVADGKPGPLTRAALGVP